MSSDPNRTINLADWRKKRTRTFETRDGLTLILRHGITVMDMIAQGTIPAPMLAAIQGLASDGDTASILEKIDEVIPAVNAVTVAAVVRPRVLSLADADALIDRLHRIYPEGTPRAVVTAALDTAAQGEDVPEIDTVPERAAIAREYREALLVSEIDFNDRMDIFTMMTGFGEGPAAAAPAAFPVAAE
jgi:hypothetical protein